MDCERGVGGGRQGANWGRVRAADRGQHAYYRWATGPQNLAEGWGEADTTQIFKDSKDC